MSREIKFRYWNTITQQMVNNPPMPHKEGWTIEQLFSDRGWVWQQYTGLKDKNGKEIYEGDCLQHESYSKSRFGIFAVEYCGSGFVGVPSNKYQWARPVTDMQEYLVIGNIYENPELLEANHD